MTKTPKRPRDPNQLAKMMVDIATGEKGIEVAASPEPQGHRGGRARAEALPRTRRVEIAKKAAAARWANEPKPVGEL